MAFIQSAGTLEMTTPLWSPGILRQSVQLYDLFYYDYATLYRTQPNVRTCVDFLARNIAQLGLHTFRRVSETDRERLRDHGLPKLLSRPLPAQFKLTYYRLMEATVSDLGVYFNAYWLKIRRGAMLGLLPVPPIYIRPQGGLVPTGYELTIGGKLQSISPDDIVHFRGYNPENPTSGLSPLETLRRILAEEHAAGDYRQGFWLNSARMNGLIKRPATAPEWSSTARERFKSEFEELYSGGNNSGKTAILEEGMEWQPTNFNAHESEYLGGRKLTREECARAYHIPLPMVGILDNATFSNITEQHKNLYQDTLGPPCAMIEQDVELQLLPEFEDVEGVYVEFNIAEKLQGDFAEQTKALQAAVGRPWLTADEARAMVNKPSLGGDAAQLVTPLNVLVGGQASPRDSSPPSPPKGGPPNPLAWPLRATSSAGHFAEGGSGFGQKGFDSHAPALRSQHEKKWIEVLSRHYRRQEAAVVSRIPAGTVGGKSDIGGIWWDDERWNSELGADLFKLNHLTATQWANLLGGQLEIEVSEEAMLPWLEEHSRIQAENINAFTREAVTEALREPEPLEAVKGIFNQALTVWTASQAVSAVTSAASFGANEAARAGNLGKKTWRVNSGNPRDEHSALNGVTVGIRDLFPNGMRWPGDPAGGAENNANCQCSVEFSE